MSRCDLCLDWGTPPGSQARCPRCGAGEDRWFAAGVAASVRARVEPDQGADEPSWPVDLPGAREKDAPDLPSNVCRTCYGSGYVIQDVASGDIEETPCPECDGHGTNTPCRGCNERASKGEVDKP